MCEPATNEQIRAEVRAIRSEYPIATVPVVELSNLALRAADTIEQQQAEIERLREGERAADKEIERLREALAEIRNELGVPQPGYPQPVANAADIAHAALGKGE
jgi:septation ring formation regulator EzrA